MKSIRITQWKDHDYYVGFLNDYPDYETQGKTKEELLENLKDLLLDLESEQVPYIRHVEALNDELVIF